MRLLPDQDRFLAKPPRWAKLDDLVMREMMPKRSCLPVLAITLLFWLLSFSTATLRPARAGDIVPVTECLCEEMRVRHVLNPGAPLDCTRLSLIKFSYVDFEGRSHENGEILVMDAAAEHVLSIFTTLREVRFPIAKAKLMNHYDGNDDASMADNNTSAFNVRNIVKGNAISLHAYGLAIDINPVQNPFATQSGATLTFSPPSGAENANRLNVRPSKPPREGMAEAVIDIFADHGFLIWGGYWDNPIDYQHFQVNRSLAEQLAKLPSSLARTAFDDYVKQYRACRLRFAGAEGRVQCIMEVDGSNP
jgi:hypothetical protein